MSEDSGAAFICGLVIATAIAFLETDSANKFEYQFGEKVCEKNDGFKYFEKRGFIHYNYYCNDEAVFAAKAIDIRRVTGGWGDK